LWLSRQGLAKEVVQVHLQMKSLKGVTVHAKELGMVGKYYRYKLTVV
jgi:hypothetical protein